MAQVFGHLRKALEIAGRPQYANPEGTFPAAPVACVLPRIASFHSRELSSRGGRRADALLYLVGIACALTPLPESCLSWQIEWLVRLADRL